MPPKSLRKVQKSISRKAGARKGLHTNSRDTKRLQRATDRELRVAKTEKLHTKSYKSITERVMFFQRAVQQRTSALSIEEAQDLIKQYLTRNNQDATGFTAARRRGQPPRAWQFHEVLERDAEQSEHRSGFWMPNLFQEFNIEALSRWDGDWISLGPLKFVRLDTENQVRESAFPPRKD